MIKQVTFFILLILGFGCSKDYIEDSLLESEVLLKATELEKKDKTKKKGIGMSYKNENWSSKVSDLNVEWHYQWGLDISPKEPDNVQYVPMSWGAYSVNDRIVDRLKQLKDEGKIRYILGFNEPDGEDQANMSVDKAIELWPKLMEVGVPLVSPATVGFDKRGWLSEFMEKAEANNLRVDYIAVHSYGGLSVANFLENIKTTYEKWGRPIWITEFAVGDWGATSVEDHKYTEEQILSFMKEVLPALDTLKYVMRYAWFPANKSNKALTTSALFDDDGNLTALGEYYAHHKQNALAGVGKDELVIVDDPGNLILNGNFETADNSYWGGYNSKTIGSYISGAHGGNYLGRINEKEGSFTYDIAVTPGTSYSLSLWNKWESNPPGKVKLVIKDNASVAKLYALELSSETNWQQSTGTFHCPNDVNSIKISIWKPNVVKIGDTKIPTPYLYIDDVVMKIE